MRLLDDRRKRFSFSAAVVVFLLAAFCSALLIWRSELDRIRVERARALNLAGTYANAIERDLDRAVSATFILAALVRQAGSIIPSFNNVGKDIMDLHPGISSLSVLPGGIVRQIYPMEGNQASLGQDVFKDPDRASEASRARESGMLTLNGPLVLSQRKLSAEAYFPIYIKNSQNEYTFWGFTAVSVLFPDVIEPVQLPRLVDQGMDYQLWRMLPNTREEQILVASSEQPLFYPVDWPVILPNGNWTLSIAPHAGWGDPFGFGFKVIIGLLFSIMLAYLVKLLIESKANEIELERRAHFDALTGLPNRRLLYDRLSQAAAQVQRSGMLTAVCFMDMDGFKAINDVFGHEAGDNMLVTIARRLEKCIRAGDTIARMGGDEFVIVLHSIPQMKDVDVALERILEAVSQPVQLGTQIVSISASIGVTLYPPDNSEIDVLLRHADLAMYQAKTNGKGCYFYYTTEPLSMNSSTEPAPPSATASEPKS